MIEYENCPICGHNLDLLVYEGSDQKLECEECEMFELERIGDDVVMYAGDFGLSWKVDNQMPNNIINEVIRHMKELNNPSLSEEI